LDSIFRWFFLHRDVVSKISGRVMHSPRDFRSFGSPSLETPPPLLVIKNHDIGGNNAVIFLLTSASNSFVWN
jgi:hypothetical protein